MASKPPVYRCAIVGSKGVGKTNLISQYLNHEFNVLDDHTIGCEFRSILRHDTFLESCDDDGHHLLQEPPITYRWHLWDLAGDRRFRTVTSKYYTDVDAIILVYDLTAPSSLEDILKVWYPEIVETTRHGPTPGQSPFFFLVGNKSDRISVFPPTSDNLVENLHLAAPLMLTSAKTGQGVDEVFSTIASVLRRHTRELDHIDVRPSLTESFREIPNRECCHLM